MKTLITQKTHRIFEAIRNADVIKLDDGTVVELYCWSPIENDADNQVLFFEWLNSEHNQCAAKFTEEGLEEAFYDVDNPNELILIDHEGEEVPINLYKLVHIDASKLCYENDR